MNNKKYNVIPHVHWDREWYFTQGKSMVYSLRHFDQLIEIIEQDDRFTTYLLDAQTSILNDYLKYRPNMIPRVRKLIKSKRLLTGPWFTQTDQVVISGESIVRNLLYGIEEANEYGHCLMVGYVVDSFGQSAQMPQIYAQLNIKSTIFKRGINYNTLPYNEFIWEGNDGSKVLAYHGVDYLNMMNVDPSTEGLKRFFSNIDANYFERSYGNCVLLFSGFDQFPIRKDLPDILEKSRSLGIENIEIVNIQDVLDGYDINDQNLPLYKGELMSGQTSRVHKSIFSSRADIKILNNHLENYISYIVEPLSVLHHMLTGKYEYQLIRDMWQLMMENSAHDSIGTCNSDEVNQQIKSRYMIVKSTLESLEEVIKRDIAVSMNESDIFQFQLYNMQPYDRSEVVELNLLSPYQNIKLITGNRAFSCVTISSKEVTDHAQQRWKQRIGISGNYDTSLFDIETIYEITVLTTLNIEGFGYNTFSIEPADELISENKKEYIENQFYTIKEVNGKIDLYVKQQDKLYPAFLELRDNADDGDSYDYSEFKDDWVLSFDTIVPGSLSVEDQGLRQIMHFDMELNLPHDLSERKMRKQTNKHLVHISLVLNNNDELIQCDLELENKSIEHRLRLVIHADLPSQYSYADQQFGVIKRPTNLDEDLAVWQEQQWAEKPRTIEPMQSFVLLKDDINMVSVMTQDVREYQIIGDDYDKIALTLYRSYSWMGKSNLEDRPGRASGMEWATPDNEIKQKLNFTYYFNFSRTDDGLNHVSKLGKKIVSPLVYHQEMYARLSMDFFNILESRESQLPTEFKEVSLISDGVQFSTLKRAENSEDYILRLYGVEGGEFALSTECSCERVQLDEMTKVIRDDVVKPGEIVTIKLGGNYEKN